MLSTLRNMAAPPPGNADICLGSGIDGPLKNSRRNRSHRPHRDPADGPNPGSTVSAWSKKRCSASRHHRIGREKSECQEMAAWRMEGAIGFSIINRPGGGGKLPLSLQNSPFPDICLMKNKGSCRFFSAGFMGWRRSLPGSREPLHIRGTTLFGNARRLWRNPSFPGRQWPDCCGQPQNRHPA